jgi:beta-phosphoglucomutase-like phosphatase (HAD superfamily)
VEGKKLSLGLSVGAGDAYRKNEFTEICEPLCARAAWRVGSAEFVLACREAGIPRYVLSGTPQVPLEAMLESNGAAELFGVIAMALSQVKTVADRLMPDGRHK